MARSVSRLLLTTFYLIVAPSFSATLSPAFADSAPAISTDSIHTDAILAEKLPQRIAQAKTLTIGSDTAYAPWEYISENDSNAVEGIDVDIMKAVAKKLGVKLDFQTSEFDAILPSLGTKYDLGVSAFSITNERLGAVDFVSYSQSGPLWAVKAGNPAKFDAADICGRIVAIQSGTDVEGLVRKESEACVTRGKKAVDALPFSSEPEALTRVAAGGADATISGSATIGYAVKQSAGRLETLKAVGHMGVYVLNGIAVSKKDRALTELIAQVTNELIKDGTMGRICDAWGVPDAAVSAAEIDPKVDD